MLVTSDLGRSHPCLQRLEANIEITSQLAFLIYATGVQQCVVAKMPAQRTIESGF